MTHRQVNKCCWENGANRFSQRVSTQLHFVQNDLSAKDNKAKHKK